MADQNQVVAALKALGLLPAGMESMQGIAEVVREGTKIVLPEGMTEDVAIEALKRMKQDQETVVQVRELVEEGFVLDAALAMMRALKKRYGWTSLVPSMGFWGPKPPQMVAIPVDEKGNTVEVPWGNVRIPGVEGTLNVGVTFNLHGMACLLVGGTVQKRYLSVVKSLAADIRQELAVSSIYRGKAIKVDFKALSPSDEDEFDPQTDRPEFMRLDPVWPSDLIFKEEVQFAIDSSVWAPITQREKCLTAGVAPKRAVLLAGFYGTGKTSIAQATANLCTANRVTFVYLERSGDLKSAVMLARQYQPAVLFAEDIDSVIGGEDRDDSVNSILNVIDGVEGKTAEVRLIVSTNHPERINRALLRFGRIDAVITLDPPDKAAVVRLLRRYAGDLLAPGEGIEQAARLMDGQIPAAIAEVVQRAKLAMVVTGRDHLTGDDLHLAAKSLQGHIAMLREKPEEVQGDIEKFGKLLGHYLMAGVKVAADKVNGVPRVVGERPASAETTPS